jgi:hypothetical protein
MQPHAHTGQAGQWQGKQATVAHDVLELDRFIPQARGTNDLVSRTRHNVPLAAHGRAWSKNLENNPMQSRPLPKRKGAGGRIAIPTRDREDDPVWN